MIKIDLPSCDNGMLRDQKLTTVALHRSGFRSLGAFGRLARFFAASASLWQCSSGPCMGRSAMSGHHFRRCRRYASWLRSESIAAIASAEPWRARFELGARPRIGSWFSLWMPSGGGRASSRLRSPGLAIAPETGS